LRYGIGSHANQCDGRQNKQNTVEISHGSSSKEKLWITNIITQQVCLRRQA
jgi:hypothetical protein